MATERLPAPPLPTERPANLRLSGFWLWVARVVWIILAGTIVVLTGIGFRPGYQSILSGADSGVIVPHTIVLAGLTASHISPAVFTTFDLVGTLLIALVTLGSALFIFWKRSDEVLALLVSLAFICMGGSIGAFLTSVSKVNPTLGLIGELIGVLGYMLLFPLLALFPDGRFRPRWAILPTILWIVFAVVLGVSLLMDTGGDNGAESDTSIGTIVGLGLFFVLILAFAWAAVYRYRRISSPLQRQQTKLVVYAGSILAVVLVINNIIANTTVDFWPAQGESALPALVETAGMLAMLPGLIGLPVAVVFAMQRYRLWDVDFLINRSLIIGGMTLLLVGMAWLTFFGLNAVLTAFVGNGQPALAAASAMLVPALLFNPTRRRLTHFVDRRFYGIQLDYVGSRRRDAGLSLTGIGTTSFGEYSNLTLLGRGGMGEVYRGDHPTLGRPVAIKILPARYVPDENARQRFLREAQLIARLKHPNIVAIYDFGEHEGVPYMIMEYVEGQDLGSIVKTRGRLPLAEALPLLDDVASALDFIHENGVVHRDVKPSNILVEKVSTASSTGAARTHRAVLTDFGIARILETASQLTQGGMIGTLDYISPEQIQGASKVDTRADVYSFGVLTYHVLTGQLPYQHGNPGAMVLAHMMTPPPDPRALSPDLPEKAANAVMRAMNKKPDDRFATTGAFLRALS